MDQRTHPNKPPGAQPTPEIADLLRMLDAQASARREARAPAASPFRTDGFRYGILIAIVVFAFGSLGILEWLLSQLPRPAHPASTPAAQAMPAGTAP